MLLELLSQMISQMLPRAIASMHACMHAWVVLGERGIGAKFAITNDITNMEKYINISANIDKRFNDQVFFSMVFNMYIYMNQHFSHFLS